MNFVIYFSYHNLQGGGSLGWKVSFLGWLFPILEHNKVIRHLEQKGSTNTNLITQIRSIKRLEK